MEERLDRLGAMMTQLITSVGNIMENQTEMRSEIQSLKSGQAQMQSDIKQLQVKQDDMQKTSDERHREIMRELSLFRRDQAVAWEKIAIHERRFVNVEKALETQQQ